MNYSDIDDESSGEILEFKDSNGKPLNKGDSVILIKDLKVGGSSMSLKRGTVVKNIKLTDDVEHISCKIGKSEVWLKTCFLKKK